MFHGPNGTQARASESRICRKSPHCPDAMPVLPNFLAKTGNISNNLAKYLSALTVNSKNKLLREFFLNALTLALLKQLIASEESEGSRSKLDPRVPPYLQG